MDVFVLGGRPACLPIAEGGSFAEDRAIRDEGLANDAKTNGKGGGWGACSERGGGEEEEEGKEKRQVAKELKRR